MVDIGRLNVVLSADAAPVQQASRTATEGLKQVEQQAAATGAQLDRLAAQMAKGMGGGSAADYRDLARKAFPTYAAAAAELGDAATAAEKVAAGAGKAATATAQAGTAAGLLAQHFDLSAGTLVRSAGALVGVGLGLSAAVGLATQVHQAIIGIVEGQLSWETSLRRTAGLYGNAASGIVATAAAQSALPDVLGTQQEFLSANLNARYLASRYALPQADIAGLTTASGRASFELGLTDEKQRADLQARMLAFADQGGNGLRDIGVEGDPLSIARRLGLSAPEGLQALTPAQLKQAQTLIATEGANQLAIGAGNAGGAAVAASTALEKAKEAATNSVRASIEQTISGQVPFGQAAGEAAVQAQLGIGQPQDQPYARSAAATQQAEADYQKAAEAVQQYTEHLQSGQSALDDTRQKLEALGVTANTATARLLAFAGSIEDPHSIARGDIAAQALAGVAARAVGPNAPLNRSDAEIAAEANARASAQAYQSYVARLAGGSLAGDNGLHDFLTGEANGPHAAAARAALEEEQRRRVGNLALGRAQQAGNLAERAQQEGQVDLNAITRGEDERRRDVALQIAGYRKQALTLEGQMVPLLLAQATLADRIEVTSRDNLETRKAIISAEQAALPANNALEDLDYGQKRTELLAQARQSRLIQGRDVSDLPGFDSLISQHVAGQLARPETELAALEANRPVQLAQRRETSEGLARGSALADLEGQARAIRDQQIPLEETARLVAAKEQTIQRTLDLLDLEDTKQKVAAQARIAEAQDLADKAKLAEFAAQDYADGLERGRDALKASAAILKDLSGGQNGAPGLTLNMPLMVLSGSGTEAIIADAKRQLEANLRRELGAASSGPPPVPSSLAGARR